MRYAYTDVYRTEDDRGRFAELAGKLLAQGYAPEDIRYFSAPGRTELGGNHTDHQHGSVLAAAVDVDTVAAVAENGLGMVRLNSKGYPVSRQYLVQEMNRPAAKGSVDALLQGMMVAFAPVCTRRGLDIFVSSTVMPGSGLSSSAAMEILLATIFNEMWNEGRLPPEKLAEFGQWTENVFFGKPCGRLDQMASAVGGVIFADFRSPDLPLVEKLDLAYGQAGYVLCIINCGGSHENLTDEYAAIPKELGAVSRFFGQEVLAQVPEQEFFQRIPELRSRLGDRPVLRAIHVYEENRRVRWQKEALLEGDFERYLQLVRESGLSSWRYLQNISPPGKNPEQPMAVALALCEHLLAGQGACRVHGGGFAGTIQAYVPAPRAQKFCRIMDGWLGAGSCTIRRIRPFGACEITL